MLDLVNAVKVGTFGRLRQVAALSNPINWNIQPFSAAVFKVLEKKRTFGPSTQVTQALKLYQLSCCILKISVL